MKFFVKYFAAFLLFLGSFSAQSASKNKETYEYLDLFGQIFDRVRSEYVEEVTDQELIEKAIDGMLTGLDPHSGYMNEEVWQEMQMDTQGKFGGLGIEITMEEGFVKVIFDAKYGEWLGCHMIGAGVTDMIAEAVLGRKLETTGHEVLKTVHPHPTMS